uniref:Integrase core domain containing protein n=1 Tax=Solanum tuberosum TaxID=4113 RepID=M1DDR5_SOLTU
MAPKQAPTYAAKGKSKFVAPSRCMIIEKDTEYNSPNITTSLTVPCTMRNRAHQVSSDVVTAPSLRMRPHRSAYRLAQSHNPAPPLAAALPHLLSLIAHENLDIGLIRDDANLAAPRRESHIEMPPPSDDMAVDVEQMQVDDSTIPATTADTQSPPSMATTQELANLRADVDALLAPPETEPEPAVFDDEVVMTSLFGVAMPPPNSSYTAGHSYF